MPIRIQPILKEVFRLSRATIPANIALSHHVQKDCGMVMGDPAQIHQVVMNLMTNAYHALGRKGGGITVSLKETNLAGETRTGRPQPSGRQAVLSIADTGCGIAPDIKDKIFDPYFTTKERGKGTGLGLAVVYGIVRDHDGDIQVESTVGKGTTFRLNFPLIVSLAADEPVEAAKPPVGGREHVLLVDDEATIVKLVKQMLERLGYRVTPYTSSLEARAAFEESPEDFDILVTDMTMPSMTGDQLARALIAIKPGLPVVLCTGYSEQIDERQANVIGIKAFLMKPVVKSKLAETVRSVLDQF